MEESYLHHNYSKIKKNKICENTHSFHLQQNAKVNKIINLVGTALISDEPKGFECFL